MNINDPIIAAIEAHRRACAETRAAYERQSAVEDELGAGVRVPAGAVENDPRWINSLFKQGIGQLEPLRFLGSRIKDHLRTGAETFELADVMLAKPALLVEACESTC